MKIQRLCAVTALIVSAIACGSNSTPTSPSTTTSTVSVLTPQTLSLGVGDSAQIRVAVVAFDNTSRLVTASGTWASTNEAIATVTSAGVVTARAPGTADITVTVTEGKATVTVTVSGQSQPMTFVGAAAGPGSQTATFSFYVVASPRLLGTVHFQRSSLSLVGRLDEPTHVVDLVGGTFRFLGVVTGNVVTGAYVDSLGLTGGFSAIDATHTAVTGFCGSYSSSGSDSGAIVLAVSSDGTTVARS